MTLPGEQKSAYLRMHNFVLILKGEGVVRALGQRLAHLEIFIRKIVSDAVFKLTYSFTAHVKVAGIVPSSAEITFVLESICECEWR